MNANGTIVVVGASSAIAEQICRILAARGESLLLVARNEEKLQMQAADLTVRGAASVETLAIDLSKAAEAQSLLAQIRTCTNNIAQLYIAFGTLPNNEACEVQPERALAEIELNFLSVVAILLPFADYFKQRNSGVITVISSVAGDRGRQSNYIYGAAKGGLSVFLQGLRNRLQPYGVRVVTVKPGFVDTPMTRDFKKGPLWSSATKVAEIIVHGVGKGRDTIYAPSFWRWIMWVIRIIPEPVFKRMKL